MTSSSFYTSLSGLKAAQTDLGVVSNNVANVGAIGFKKSRAEFGDMFSTAPLQSGSTPGLGTRLKGIDQDFTQGGSQTSDRTLDVSVQGQGFFVTKGKVDGEVSYTRAGAFNLATDRSVVDGRGAIVQVLPVDAGTGASAGGSSDVGSLKNLVVPASTTDGKGQLTNLSIGKDGLVGASYSDGSTVYLGKIAVADFPDTTGLRQAGNSAWTQTATSGAPIIGEGGSGGLGNVQSGALEQANVDITEELVNLIAAQRNFQANAKAIDTANQMTQIAANLRGS